MSDDLYTNDMVAKVDSAIEAIKRELELPENYDLLIAMMLFPDNDNNRDEESFMGGFANAYTPTMGFIEYDNLMQSVMSQLIEQNFPIDYNYDTPKMYEEYLKRQESGKNETPLSRDQASRFDAIVDKYADGWSGMVYGVACRVVQRDLRLKYQPKL